MQQLRLKCFPNNCKQSNISFLDVIKELSGRAISGQLWRNSRERQLLDDLLVRCPHICPPCSPVASHLNSRLLQIPTTLDLNVDALNALILRYSRILSKVTRLKSLKMKRAKLIKQNIGLLSELTDMSTVNNRTLQNLFDGICLSDPFTSKAENSCILDEMHCLSELLLQVEADQKDEEMFWKWISSPVSSGSTFTASTESTLLTESSDFSSQLFCRQLLNEIHDHMRLVDSKVVEVLHDRKLPVLDQGDELIRGLTRQLESLVAEELDFDPQSSCEKDEESAFDENAFINKTNQLWATALADVLELSNAQSPFAGNIISNIAPTVEASAESMGLEEK